jgi:DNA-binding transcriptional regulator YdaS (Cro superfamily)
MNTEQALKKAIKRVGSQRKLSALLGISQQVISHWVSKGRVSAEQVLPIEKITGVPCYELRPDIYPVERFKKAS